MIDPVGVTYWCLSQHGDRVTSLLWGMRANRAALLLYFQTVQVDRMTESVQLTVHCNLQGPDILFRHFNKPPFSCWHCGRTEQELCRLRLVICDGIYGSASDAGHQEMVASFFFHLSCIFFWCHKLSVDSIFLSILVETYRSPVETTCTNIDYFPVNKVEIKSGNDDVMARLRKFLNPTICCWLCRVILVSSL